MDLKPPSREQQYYLNLPGYNFPALVELRCTYDENTLGKKPEGRKVKGVIHWVSAAHALDAEIRLYDRLFKE
jgi:hypothetical protein